MMQRRIKKLLEPLFLDYGETMVFADEAMLEAFRDKTIKRGIPSNVINQLAEFYRLTNGVPCLDGFDFHRCDDEIIFEWWEDGELWLGQRDMDILRWANGVFSCGDASNTSYGKEYEFSTLVELLEAAFLDWYGM